MSLVLVAESSTNAVKDGSGLRDSNPNSRHSRNYFADWKKVRFEEFGSASLSWA